MFLRTEGFLPAPESAYSIACAIDEALKCKEQGVEKVIAFNVSGHGFIDMEGYTEVLGLESETMQKAAAKAQAPCSQGPTPRARTSHTSREGLKERRRTGIAPRPPRFVGCRALRRPGARRSVRAGLPSRSRPTGIAPPAACSYLRSTIRRLSVYGPAWMR